MVLGIPTDSDPGDDLLMDKGAYVVSYNPKRLSPNWVSWNLTEHHLGRVGRADRFRADPSLPPGMVRVGPQDYAHSGFDRGHLCPSADRTANLDENAATFLMTNIQPQLHELNVGPWEELEIRTRQLAVREHRNVFVVAGGVFDPAPTVFGPGIAVPASSFKIVVALRPGEGAADVTLSTPVLAVIMPNGPGVSERGWQTYQVAIDQIEAATGYDLLSKVPEPVQREIESRIAN